MLDQKDLRRAFFIPARRSVRPMADASCPVIEQENVRVGQTLAWRRPSIAGVSAAWSALVMGTRMESPDLKRRAVGTNGIGLRVISPMGTA